MQRYIDGCRVREEADAQVTGMLKERADQQAAKMAMAAQYAGMSQHPAMQTMPMVSCSSGCGTRFYVIPGEENPRQCGMCRTAVVALASVAAEKRAYAEAKAKARREADEADENARLTEVLASALFIDDHEGEIRMRAKDYGQSRQLSSNLSAMKAVFLIMSRLPRYEKEMDACRERAKKLEGLAVVATFGT